jgi:hypothetical protein
MPSTVTRPATTFRGCSPHSLHVLSERTERRAFIVDVNALALLEKIHHRVCERRGEDRTEARFPDRAARERPGWSRLRPGWVQHGERETTSQAWRSRYWIGTLRPHAVGIRGQGEGPPHQGARDGRRVDWHHQVPQIRIQPPGGTLSRDDGRMRPTCGAWAEPHQAASGSCRKEGDCPGGMSETRGPRSPYPRCPPP